MPPPSTVLASAASHTHNHGRFGERLIASPWRWILFPAWLIYRPIIGIRNLAFDRGWRRSQKLSVPVISIGNIIAGGSGKTPIVEKISTLLQADYAQQHIHVLSRGYKSSDSSNDSDNGAGTGTEKRNEEAELLSCRVHCNSNRYQGGEQAIKDGAKILIMDDGFQHRQLHRVLDIVLIDATRPWGTTVNSTVSGSTRGAVLPLGFLRESPAALKRADVIILTRCNQSTVARTHTLSMQLERFHKPVLHCEHLPSHFSKLDQEDRLPLSHLSGRTVILISGIAHPQSFHDSITALGITVAAHHTFDDHHHYNRKDIQLIQQLYREEDVSIICTSKDAVKLKSLWSMGDTGNVENVGDNSTQNDGLHTHKTAKNIPCFVLHIDIQFLNNDRHTLQKILHSITT